MLTSIFGTRQRRAARRGGRGQRTEGVESIVPSTTVATPLLCSPWWRRERGRGRPPPPLPPPSSSPPETAMDIIPLLRLPSATPVWMMPLASFVRLDACGCTGPSTGSCGDGPAQWGKMEGGCSLSRATAICLWRHPSSSSSSLDLWLGFIAVSPFRHFYLPHIHYFQCEKEANLIPISFFHSRYRRRVKLPRPLWYPCICPKRILKPGQICILGRREVWLYGPCLPLQPVLQLSTRRIFLVWGDFLYSSLSPAIPITFYFPVFHSLSYFTFLSSNHSVSQI